MRLEFIKEIVSAIIGKIGEKLVNILYKTKNVNEFLIAKKLGLTINQTRNLLYKLSDKGLVYFIRKKDSKRGGWYTYFWTLNEKKALETLKEQKTVKITALEEELEKRKNERFYYCPTSGLEYKEEEALEHNFICPETGEVLQLKNNENEINKTEIEISKLKLIGEEITKELEEVNEKEMKDKRRKLKAEIKKKEEERRKKREKLKRARKRDKKKGRPKLPSIKKHRPQKIKRKISKKSKKKR